MKRARRGVAIITVIVMVMLGTVPQAVDAAQRFAVIGTGSIAGMYYPTGIAIGDIANSKRNEHGFRYAVFPTAGSKLNIKSVESGELDFGFVQSDVHHQAVKGIGNYKKHGATANVRSVFSLYFEPFHIIARADGSINTLEDLVGKKINIGKRGAGSVDTFITLMKAMGWVEDSFLKADDYKPEEKAEALCDGRVDVVMFATVNHAKVIKDITSTCPTKIIDIDGPKVDAMLSQLPYFQKTIIPGGIYEGNSDNITSFGVVATLVANANVPKDIVYEITKTVFDNFEGLKKAHPGFASLKMEEMISIGLDAPLHQGAIKYYKEAGLM